LEVAKAVGLAAICRLSPWGRRPAARRSVSAAEGGGSAETLALRNLLN